MHKVVDKACLSCDNLIDGGCKFPAFDMKGNLACGGDRWKKKVKKTNGLPNTLANKPTCSQCFWFAPEAQDCREPEFIDTGIANCMDYSRWTVDSE